MTIPWEVLIIYAGMECRAKLVKLAGYIYRTRLRQCNQITEVMPFMVWKHWNHTESLLLRVHSVIAR